jgi:hypothetical protein
MDSFLNPDRLYKCDVVKVVFKYKVSTTEGQEDNSLVTPADSQSVVEKKHLFSFFIGRSQLYWAYVSRFWNVINLHVSRLS